jgi:hypothetical protein
MDPTGNARATNDDLSRCIDGFSRGAQIRLSPLSMPWVISARIQSRFTLSDSRTFAAVPPSSRTMLNQQVLRAYVAVTEGARSVGR